MTKTNDEQAEANAATTHAHGSMKHGSSYGRFLAMIATSTVIMLGLMYLNSYQLSHVRFSETRTYMALYMGGMMSLVMLAFMWGMYKDKAKSWAIVAGSVLLFAVALFLVRSQVTVQDRAWMKAMIPHHSIAILTSERAEINDVRVRELANEIIDAQRREIAVMEWLIQDIKDNGKAATQAEADARPVPDFSTSDGQ